MSPTLVKRFAHEKDLTLGIYASATTTRDGKWLGSLDGSRIPNPFGDPLLIRPQPAEPGDGFKRFGAPDCDNLFACTEDQYREWWTAADHIEAHRRYCCLYTLMVCGRRWIGEYQVVFDSVGAIVVEKV